MLVLCEPIELAVNCELDRDNISHYQARKIRWLQMMSCMDNLYTVGLPAPLGHVLINEVN